MEGHDGYPRAVAAHHPISRTYTYKKVTKPMLERRRRARISKCLDDLKALMVGPLQMTEESLNRLEKADILELAVQHLQTLRTGNPNKYQEGFNECAAEACHFLEKTGDVDGEVGERLVEHLETCIGPLSIQVPQFRLTFSSSDSPQSPRSSGRSPQPSGMSPNFHGPSTPPSGLLMEATRESVLVFSRLASTAMSSQSTKSYGERYPRKSWRGSPYPQQTVSCPPSRQSMRSWATPSSSSSLDMWRPW